MSEENTPDQFFAALSTLNKMEEYQHSMVQHLVDILPKISRALVEQDDSDIRSIESILSPNEKTGEGSIERELHPSLISPLKEKDIPLRKSLFEEERKLSLVPLREYEFKKTISPELKRTHSPDIEKIPKFSLGSSSRNMQSDFPQWEERYKRQRIDSPPAQSQSNSHSLSRSTNLSSSNSRNGATVFRSFSETISRQDSTPGGSTYPRTRLPETSHLDLFPRNFSREPRDPYHPSSLAEKFSSGSYSGQDASYREHRTPLYLRENWPITERERTLDRSPLDRSQDRVDRSHRIHPSEQTGREERLHSPELIQDTAERKSERNTLERERNFLERSFDKSQDPSCMFFGGAALQNLVQT